MKKATTKATEPQVNATIKRLNAAQITRLQKQLEQLTKDKLAQEEKKAATERATVQIGAGRRLVSYMEDKPGLQDILMAELKTALVKNNTTVTVGNKEQFPLVAPFVAGFYAQEREAVNDVNTRHAARKKAIVDRKEEILNQIYFGDTAPDVCALLAEFNNF